MRLERVSHQDITLQVLHAPRVAPGLRFLPDRLRQRLEARWLRQVEALVGAQIEAVWLFENSRFYDMRFAGHRLKIYHQVDLNQDFHPNKAAQTADVVVALNPSIAQRLETLAPGKSVTRVSHGLSIAPPPDPAPDVSAFGPDKLHAIYVGNLGIPYLDIDAFLNVVEAHSEEVLFHLFGTYDDTTLLYQRLRDCKNVVWWGRVPADHIGYYLEQADINMLIYKAKDNALQLANSHKILEYLYSGHVTVASYTDDYAQQPDLLEMAAIDGDYAGVFASVVRNIAHHNTPALKEKRRAFARARTYARKLDQIADVVLRETGHTLCPQG